MPQISGLPSATTPLTGAELIPLSQSGVASQTALSNIAPAGEVHAQWFGCKFDGVTDDTANLQAAINSIASSGGTVVMPTGQALITGTGITVPALVSLRGQSMSKTQLLLNSSTASVTLSSTPYVNHYGYMSDFTVNGNNLATAGMVIQGRSILGLNRVYFFGVPGRGLYINSCIDIECNMLLFQNCGTATLGQFEIDGVAVAGNISTTILLNSIYISTGATGCQAGLKIDRSRGISIVGGAIESCGIPLMVCSKSEGTYGVNQLTLRNVDMENATDHYIEAGYGWSGATGQGTVNMSVTNSNGSVSGSPSILYAVKLKNTDSFTGINNSWSLTASPTSVYWLEGTSNLRTSLSQHGGSIAYPFVSVNSATRADAVPYLDWKLLGGASIFFQGASFALNSATPSISGDTLVSTNSGVATTITNVTGGIQGQLMAIYAGDANTTLKHLNTGAGQFRLKSGANTALSVGLTYLFILDSSGTWSQI
ncbi:MAG: hypothetical protein KGH65_03595 [Candidatus Micrarchaeota archaeon]|nr:hypothetical protein [Candidatus Micrarchaeota archaeon]